MTVIRHPNNQGVTLSQWRKTAAGGETSVSGTDDFSAGLAYTAGAEQVFVNGVLLERGVDYTASTGTTVTGLTALVAGDIVTVSSPSAFNVANAIPKATITAKGDLLVGTGASTPANLAVGADGTTLVANSANASGLGWVSQANLPYTWSNYTPSYNGITVGNGTVVARYIQIGKMVNVYYSLTWGSTTSITGSLLLITMPTSASSNYIQYSSYMGDAGFQKTGTAYYMGYCDWYNNTYGIRLNTVNAAGTYAVGNSVSTTAPSATWASGDIWNFKVSYEAA